MAELVIRGGQVVTPDGVSAVDVAVEDGRISAVGPQLPGAVREIDANGLHVLPGLIDIHVHFNEPGRAEWEGSETGSRALAAGGGTLFFDMPLNSTPCTLNRREFENKRSALEDASVTDFALWGGLTPDSLNELDELAACGVIGFKAFLSDSGLPEFPRCDDLTLYEGMRAAARLGLPVAVHAESEELTRRLTAKALSEDRCSIRDYLNSRPILAELDAIQRATLFAGETGAKLHIVHISSGQGVLLAAEAKARGVDVSIETCPHYLQFTEDDLLRLGAVAKCAPPLRSEAVRQELWQRVTDGHVDVVASDHSPAPASMKAGSDFFRIWGGIAGVQSTLSVLLGEGVHQRGLPLTRVASLIAAYPANRFRVAAKGRVALGMDADLALIDLFATTKLEEASLFQRHPISPYLGREFRGAVRQTIRRGETIFADGKITAQSQGRLVRPSSQ